MFCGRLEGRGVCRRMDTCIYMAESLRCSPEIITTLLISCTLIPNKKLKKKIGHLRSSSEFLLGLSGKSSFLHKSWFLYRGCGPEMTIIGTMTLRVTSCKAEWQEWRHVLDPRFESLYSESSFNLLNFLFSLASSFLHKSWFLYRGCGPEMTIIGTMTLRVTSCKAEWQEWRHVLDPRFESLYSESSFNLLNFLFSLANRFPLWFNKLGCDIMGCIAFLPNHNVDFLPLYTSECDYLVITEVIKVN